MSPTLAGIAVSGGVARTTVGAARGIATARSVIEAEDLGSKLLRLADTYKALQDRIHAVTEEASDAERFFRELQEIANSTRRPIESTVDFFARLAGAAADLGTSKSDKVRFTEVVEKLGVIGGTSPEQITAGMTKFAVAMADGVIDAGEFKATLEDLPAVARKIREGFDGSDKQFRDALDKDKVFSREVIDDLLSQKQEITKAFEQIDPDFSGAKQSLRNSVIEVIGEFDEKLGISSIPTKFVQFIADNLPDAAEAILETGEIAARLLSPDHATAVLAAIELQQGKAGAAARLHSEALRDLGTNLEDVGRAVQKLSIDTLETKIGEINAAIEAIQEVINDGVGTIDSAISRREDILLFEGVDPAFGVPNVLPVELEARLDQIKDLRQQARDGKIDSIAFANSVIEIADKHTELAPLAEKLREIVQPLIKARENLTSENEILKLVTNQWNELDAAAKQAGETIGEVGTTADEANGSLRGVTAATENVGPATDKTAAATEDACAAVEANRKCLEELATVTEEAGAATGALAQSSAGLGPGLERENKQLTARAKIVPGLTQQLKKEFDSRNLVAQLVQILGRELLPEEIQQLNEILALRGQTVEQLDAEAEARRDVAQAAGEQAEAGLVAGGAGGFGIPFVPDNEGIANQLGRPFEIAVGDIQQEFAGLFDRLFTDGIGAFADMGRNIKGIFKYLASNIARMLIFSPQVLSIGGLGGTRLRASG